MTRTVTRTTTTTVTEGDIDMFKQFPPIATAEDHWHSRDKIMDSYDARRIARENTASDFLCVTGPDFISVTPDRESNHSIARFVATEMRWSNNSNMYDFCMTWERIAPWLDRLYAVTLTHYKQRHKAARWSRHWCDQVEWHRCRIGVDKVQERYREIVAAQDTQAACTWLGPARLLWLTELIKAGRVPGVTPAPPLLLTPEQSAHYLSML